MNDFFYRVTCLLKSSALVFVLFASDLVHAHEAHDKEIHRLDLQLQQLDSTRTDALQVLLRRADLHRREKDWNAALVDYNAVATIQPDNSGMLLGMSQLHLDQNDFLAALRTSKQVLERQSNHIQALLLHARAKSGLGDNELVPDLYNRAINLMESPKPEHYIEHAHSVLQSKSDSAPIDAIAIVDIGAKRLNHPISLHSFALEQEIQSKQYAAAAARIDRVLAMHPRLWLWHIKRIELLKSLNRVEEVCSSIATLENELREVPLQRRRTQAMQSIQEQIDDFRLECTK